MPMHPGRRVVGVALAAALALVGPAVAAPATAAPATAAPSYAAPATAAAAAAPGGLAAASVPARVATSATPGPTLRWGFRAAFRSYVGGAMNPLPAGERIVPVAPAAFDATAAGTSETRPYQFPVAARSTTRGTTTVTTQGAVRYSYPAHMFAITLSDITVSTSADGVTVVADLSVTDERSGAPVTTLSDGVTLGTAPLATQSTTGSRVRVTAAGLSLTAAGAAGLKDFLPAGSKLDDLELTYDTAKVKASKAAAKVTAKLAKKKIARTARARVAVTVSAPRTTPSGKVRVTATKGKKTVTRTVTLTRGKATATLPRLAKGTWKVKARYAGSAKVAAKSARTVLLKVR